MNRRIHDKLMSFLERFSKTQTYNNLADENGQTFVLSLGDVIELINSDEDTFVVLSQNHLFFLERCHVVCEGGE